MNIRTKEALTQAKCTPCEGGVTAFSKDDAAAHSALLENWELADDGRSIFKKWNCGSFVKVMKLANQIADLAEQEQHHPDLHITGYRHLQVVLMTHAVGGLSENDFILAAKIDQLD